METLEFRQKFKRFFPTLNPNEYIDTELWLIDSNRVRIDIIKFDRWMYLEYGEYEKQGLSLKTALEKFVNKEAALLIYKLL
jgi:hypothetical protein